MLVIARILLDGKLVATHSVAGHAALEEDAERAAKGEALRAAIRAGQITISQALRATVEVEEEGQGTGTGDSSGPSK
jgi:hypothetical protein